MRLKVGTALIALSLILAGCSGEPKRDIVRTEVKVDVAEVGAQLDGIDALDVHEYNFGSRTVTLSTGEAMTFDVRGRVSVPKTGGAHPIVFAVHGKHELIDVTKRFDGGFDYLVGHLAAKETIGVSIDANRAFVGTDDPLLEEERLRHIVDANVDMWMKAHNGSVQAPVPIAGKVNPKKIGLIGYAESSPHVLTTASFLERKGWPVASILLVAPSVDHEPSEWPKSNIGMIVSEFDSIVKSYDGYKLYDAMEHDEDRISLITLLKKGNHSYFNRAIDVNDVAQHGTNYELKHQLKREDQEQFLKQYASDFFLGTLNDSETSLIRNLQIRPQPDQMYWQDVTVMARLAGSETLVDFKEDVEEEKPSKLNKVRTERVIDDVRPEKDEIEIDTVVASDGPTSSRPMLRIDWMKKGSYATFTPSRTNLVGKEVIAVDFVVDPVSELNKSEEYQPFAVQLEDEDGNIARASLADELNATHISEGGLELVKRSDGKRHEVWSKYTPLASVRIPMERFDSIDLERVKTIRLVFNKTESGSMFVYSIQAQ
ncbi:hypothetical protein GOP80_08625 [Planococcaceae bacterium Storch 2/2-2]|nr:hypothetical protein [Planococcaceae bacterium Storch 2/2-2]